jgi:hypothetical protein
MKRYFNTKEKALKHLEYRKACAYSRIEKRGDKILHDGSRVYCDAQDSRWKVIMDIWTEEALKIAEKIHGMDYEKDRALIPFSPEEKRIQKEILKNMFLKIHKTNETIDDTINKDL